MLWDLALKDLWKRWLRSLLTILGIAVAIHLYLITNNMMVWMERNVQRQLGAIAGKVYVQQPMRDTGFGEDFPSMTSSIAIEKVAPLLGLEGVDPATSAPVLFVPLVATTLVGMPPTVLAAGIQPGYESAYLGSVAVESGSASLSEGHAAIIGPNAAKYYQASVGDTIQIRGQDFTVIGVLKLSSEVFDNSVIIPLETAQELFQRQDSVSAVILTAGQVEDAPRIQQLAQAQFPELEASTEENLARNADEVLKLMRQMFTVINSSIMLAVIVSVAIVIGISVMEQRKEIGTLRAIGARRGRIFSFVVIEALVLSLSGALLAFPLKKFTELVILQFGRISLLQDELGIWFGSILMAALVGVLAALLPAWQAMRVDPLEAMRYE